MINIAIADDHPLLLEGLKKILNNKENIIVVACYSSINELITDIKKQEINVLLLDINLGDVNSIELIPKILKLSPVTEIVMLSVHNELPVINSCINEGAKGYLQKNATIDEIIDSIKTVFNGDTFYCSQTIKIMNNKNETGLNVIPKLTRREKEILLEASIGLTTNQIAEKLFISPHTVESHRKNLIEKFKTSNLSSAIKLAIEYNLITNK